MTQKKKCYLIQLLISPVLVGGIGALLSLNAKEVYSSLRLPDFAPPSWLFGVIWPILYLLLGIAASLVCTSSAGLIRQRALGFHYAQLAVNLLWVFVFFRMLDFTMAAVLILLLITLILCTMTLFFKVRKSAGWLMLPYLLWVAFASVLTICIAFMNP
ncbi:MAG: tryptophan-rich sensory protein [Clostridiales bacterium]|nr:tryptophan-rich sensory protein [Clostridiales bacterium]